MTLLHPAIVNLREYQRQLDPDGVEVGVSRQALDETLELASDLYGALSELKDIVARNGLAHSKKASAALAKAEGAT